MFHIPLSLPVRRLLRSGPFWSFLTAVMCFVRGASYAFRPPLPTPTSDLIEGNVGYQNWALLLFLAGILIVAGHWLRFTAWLGHMVGFVCYAIFASSIAAGALIYDQPWASFGAVFIVATLHLARALIVADEL